MRSDDATSSRDGGGAIATQLLEALARDTEQAAEAITRFLKILESGADDEAAKKEAADIMRRIPSMLPEDPAGAAVIADAMAEAYAAAAETTND